MPVIRTTTPMSRPSLFDNCVFRIVDCLPDGLLVALAYVVAWLYSKNGLMPLESKPSQPRDQPRDRALTRLDEVHDQRMPQNKLS